MSLNIIYTAAVVCFHSITIVYAMLVSILLCSSHSLSSPPFSPFSRCSPFLLLKTLLEHLKHKYGNAAPPNPAKSIPTVGLNVAKLDVSSKERLMCWDLGGQSSLRTIWDKYFDDAHAIVFVVDATDEKRFDEAKTEAHDILSHNLLDGAPMLVLANKQDRKEAKSAGEVGKAMGLMHSSIGTARHFRVQPVSALKGVGVVDAVNWLLEVLPTCKRTTMLHEKQNKNTK
jgi:ADP-ribosylation factor related protein 1